MFIKALSGLLVGISIFSASLAAAQDKPMKLESTVHVLKAEQESEAPTLVDAKNVVPGDQLVFTTSYRNQGSAAVDNFVIVNPVPSDVVLAEEPEAAAAVSVDGAKTWGTLADLVVVSDEGEERPASIADITHLRWAFSAIPSGETGQVRFSAIVR